MIKKLKSSLAAGLCGLAFLAGCQSVSSERYQAEVIPELKGLYAPRYFDLEDAVEANELLINFPDKLPGAKSVNKYLVPGAKKVMVHIRQEHYGQTPFRFQLKKVERVQREIKETLGYLIRYSGLRQVYREGLSPVFADLETRCAQINLYADRESRLENMKAENPAMYEDYVFFEKTSVYDAVYQVAREVSGFKILSAEAVNTLSLAEDLRKRSNGMNSFKNTSSSRAFDIIFENREDAFLEIAGKQDAPVAVVVYGAAHAWGGEASCGRRYVFTRRESKRDNIAKWNSIHPDNKFSLIEIEPNSLHDLF